MYYVLWNINLHVYSTACSWDILRDGIVGSCVHPLEWTPGREEITLQYTLFHVSCYVRISCYILHAHLQLLASSQGNTRWRSCFAKPCRITYTLLMKCICPMYQRRRCSAKDYVHIISCYVRISCYILRAHLLASEHQGKKVLVYLIRVNTLQKTGVFML